MKISASELVKTILANGHTLEEIARVMNVSTATVWRWKTGRTQPIKSLRAKLEELAEKSQGPLRKSP